MVPPARRIAALHRQIASVTPKLRSMSTANNCASFVSRLAAAAVAGPTVAHRAATPEHPGTAIETIDHEFDMPLDWAKPEGEKLTVFAREVVSLDFRGDKQGMPWLVFLQGGPGGASPRPTSSSGWLKRALQDYRVLLLDQRGTGLSTPVTTETLVWCV